jgi:hypothetical protein
MAQTAVKDDAMEEVVYDSQEEQDRWPESQPVERAEEDRWEGDSFKNAAETSPKVLDVRVNLR